MKIAGLAAFAGIAVASLLATSMPASAQADCKAVVAPSPFGPDDQTGATNRVTPAVTKAAAAEIQTGVVTLMANNLVDLTGDYQGPSAGTGSVFNIDSAIASPSVAIAGTTFCRGESGCVF